MTAPASPDDRVAALRIEALHTTNRIVATLGTPLALWAAWSSWPEDRAFVVTGVVLAGLFAFPVALPDRARALRRLSTVAALLCAATAAWLWDGAFATTGVLLWSSVILAALAIGPTAATTLLLGAALLLVSASFTESTWVLPISVGADDADILTRFVVIFSVLTTIVLSVVWGVITPLERSLAAATDLVQALRREQRARAALDQRLTQHDLETRLRIAQRLQRHLRARLTSLERSLTKAGEQGTHVDNAAVDNAIGAVGHLVEYVRAASRQLRPVLLDETGLAPALRSLASSELGRNAIPYEIDVSVDQRLPPAVEVACYRIVQEAIDNIVYHAQPTRARVFVACRSHEIAFTVEDNGIGFDLPRVLAQEPPALGLLGMRRRSDALGGTLQIDSGANRGTRVYFVLPLVGSR